MPMACVDLQICMGDNVIGTVVEWHFDNLIVGAGRPSLLLCWAPSHLMGRTAHLYIHQRPGFCRYIPCVGDNVIGMVVERHSDNLIVDIGGPFHAVLNSLAFEGATRRNRPKLAEGDLVYARVTLAHKDVDTELSCTEVSGKVRLILWIPVLQGSLVIKASCTAFCDLCSPRTRLGVHTSPWCTHGASECLHDL